jgi:DNA-directed RNA polymerase subunit RPC12/RpoP
MAIQFPCGACGQPVEIDDEWGGKTVACPFCHSQIIAPTESSLGDSEPVPMASAVQGSTPPTIQAVHAPQPVVGTNRLAIVAVVLAGVMLVSLIMFNRCMSPHVGELQAMVERMAELTEQGKGMLMSIQTAQLEMFEKSGGTMPPWMYWGVMFEILGGLTWLAAIICGAIAVSRPQHRRYSIAALVACGIAPIVLCCMGPGM